MALCSVQEMANTKPLFVGIQVTVLAAIILTTIYVGKPVYSEFWSPKSEVGLSPQKDGTVVSSPPELENSSKGVAFKPPSDRDRSTGGGRSVSPSWPTNIWERPIWDPPPTGAKLPDAKAFRLTKSLVKHYAKNNVIIVTFGNFAFMDFVLNWVRHLTDLGVYNLLVGAMDTKLLEALYWKGVPVFDMKSNMDTSDVGWGSPKFHKMGREKVTLINEFLPFGYELLMCDTDMVWLKNPLPYIARYPDADVLTSSDQVIPTVIDDRLEDWRYVSGAYNIGIFHWRPTDASKRLAAEWKEMLLADEKIWDQNGFNDLLHKFLGPSVDEESGLVYARNRSLKLGILPASIFCSGHTYFVQAMYQQLRLEPYAVHTTFQYAGTEGKRHRLREAMLFYDEPEYYDSPGGFLAFKPSIPKSELLDGPHTVESHFSLVNHQIKQVRSALAIALLLNRTLVMPPLWCKLDRLWYGHPGVLPGTLTRQPFLCPMDHIFEVNVMLKNLPEEEFGPRIDFREYSFLENPLLPESIKKSRLNVQLCDPALSNCQASNTSMQPRAVLKFPKHSTEEMYKSVFSAYKDVKIIKFSSIDDAFQGFSDKLIEEKFRHRVSRYVGIWCCVEQQEIGHIYYDMYWDEKPGWKPKPPATREENRPPWI
ncbi:arabinosyltransferase XEG113 [Nymphaea colorata]|nr:arabinosyltransferase XEG113 [Nymphaea colorata]